MNVLVTGACGQLGCTIREISSSYDHNFIFADIVSDDRTSSLDATDPEAVGNIVRANDIDVIINCAGYTDVNRAEDDEEKAYRINADLPAVLASAAKEAGAMLIHISTDYVFDGSACVPYREDEQTGPLGAYARTKLAGERAVVSSGCRYMIFRTAWLYSSYGNNFFKTMEEKTSSLPTVNVVIDQVGTPTYAYDLASAIMHVIDNDLLDNVGTYHYTNEGVCSWYDFAKAINRAFGYTCDIRPCRSDDYPSKVKRPSFSVLDKTLFKKTFGLEIPHWEDSLEVAVNEYNSKVEQINLMK